MHFITRGGALLLSGVWLFLGIARAAPPALSDATATGRVGTAFSFLISATSTLPTTFNAQSLPPGLTVNTSSGLIGGTPTTAGTFSVTISATNADGTTNARLTLTIDPAASGLPVVLNESFTTSIEWESSSNPLGWTTLLQATNEPVAFSVSGLPPPAFVLSNRIFWGGTSSGPHTAAGIYPITIAATNAAGSTSKAIQVTIHPSITDRRPDRASYRVGDTVRIVFSFNGPVVVTGSPTTPAAGGRAVYESGSGTSQLVFAYTLQPGDFGIHQAFALIELNGGSIRHAGTGLEARLYGPIYHSSDRSGEFVVLGPPVITSATTATSTVGTAFSYKITALNAPAEFGARGLPEGLSVNRTTGDISGVPTTAGTFSIILEATNSQVTTPGTQTLALTVAPAPTTTPPPTTPPPPIVQTITLNAPSSVTVGQPATIGASASSGLPVTLAVVSGNATLSGTTLLANAGGSIVISATQAGGNGYAAASATATLTAVVLPPPPVPPPTTPPTPPPVVAPPPPVAQTISFAQPASVVVGQPVTISATASSGLPVALTVVSGNATLSGTQLTVNTADTVVVRATQTGGSGFAPATADLTLSATRASQTLDFVSPVSTVVIGQPIQLSAMASSGLPVAYSIVSGNATISGTALTITGPGAVVVRATQAGSETINPASSEITITGAVRAAQTIAMAPAATELLSDRTLALSATASSGLPVTFEVVSGPARLDGNVLTPTAAAGTVTLRALQPGSDAFEGAEMTRTFTILPASRLINLSSRVAVREGDTSRSFIAGFVVSGSAPKRMLVRAIGPALVNFGVQAALANPRLRVFDQAGRLLGENDDWSGAELAAAFARVGAFALAPGGRDAALLVTLPPGAYSLHVEAGGAEGIALAEIYDASDVPALETQQMINISTRAYVETGEGVLAAGFVVTGSVPKRVLIRGVGPGLGAFGVSGALADPALRVYRGDTVIAQNDDWQTPQQIAGAPIMATAAEIAAASTGAGAFPLGNGAKDAALIITLPPGAYTAIVSGANSTTGAGLVEVYEVTQPQP